MSNSIWKTPDQRPGNIDRLVVRYLNDDTHYNICVDEVYNWSHVKEWCYLADLIAQADKAERLQKAVDLAADALESISGVRGNIEDYYGGVSIHYQQMVLHMDEIATNALEQIGHHIADASKMVEHKE